ncbi:MAG: LuxR family transcriptional [Desulfobulbaceae bacterium]|jgi:LuxR family transcriptional regulator of csgAB operon|nr:MAG: LuxR family transcriptional [Desulfobulbaceae bacterium]
MAEHLIHIVGNSSLQNELLITYLAKETGFQITNSAKIEDVALAESRNDDSKLLLIFDCMGVPRGEFWAQSGLQPVLNSSQVMLALLNVEPGQGLEKEAISRGVRGLFYVNEKPALLSKGIVHIIAGELWYSRKIISQCLLEQGVAYKTPLHHSVKLSTREKEILIEITSGASNQEIAEALFVSQYTVKTHVYNIYKKINVTSRLQAMLWAAKHL